MKLQSHILKLPKTFIRLGVRKKPANLVALDVNIPLGTSKFLPGVDSLRFSVPGSGDACVRYVPDVHARDCVSAGPRIHVGFAALNLTPYPHDVAVDATTLVEPEGLARRSGSRLGLTAGTHWWKREFCRFALMPREDGLALVAGAFGQGTRPRRYLPDAHSATGRSRGLALAFRGRGKEIAYKECATISGKLTHEKISFDFDKVYSA